MLSSLNADMDEVDLTTKPLTLLTSTPFKSTSPHLRIVRIPPPSRSTAPSSSSSSSSASSALQLLFQRSRSGHVYVQSFGEPRVRAAGRTLPRPKWTLQQIIERTNAWHEGGLDERGRIIVEVLGGIIPLEHGDRIESGVRLFMYEEERVRVSSPASGARRLRERGDGAGTSATPAKAGVEQQRHMPDGQPQLLRRRAGGEGSVEHAVTAADERAVNDVGMQVEQEEKESQSAQRPLNGPSRSRRSTAAAALPVVTQLSPTKARTRERRHGEAAVSGASNARDEQKEEQKEAGEDARKKRLRRGIGARKEEEKKEEQPVKAAVRRRSRVTVGPRKRRRSQRSTSAGSSPPPRLRSDGSADFEAVGEPKQQKRRQRGAVDEVKMEGDVVEGQKEPPQQPVAPTSAKVERRRQVARARQPEPSLASAPLDGGQQSERQSDGREAVARRRVRGATVQPPSRVRSARAASTELAEDEQSEDGEEEEKEEEEKQPQPVEAILPKKVKRRRGTREQASEADAAPAPADSDDGEDGEQEEEQKEPAADSSPQSRARRAGPAAARSSFTTRRRTRGLTRRTRSSGTVEPVEELQSSRASSSRKQKKRQERKKKSQAKEQKAGGSELRRRRRTPLSLKEKIPSSLRSLLSHLSCPVCTQLFIQPVALPCSHVFCDYCVYAHFQLKAVQCPVCDAAVDDDDWKEGRYSVRVDALGKAAADVAERVLDGKGERSRRRRIKADGAEMKKARTGWKRIAAVQKKRERREREKKEIEEEMALFRRRMRPHARRGAEEEGEEEEKEEGEEEEKGRGRGRRSGGAVEGSDEDELDDDFVPNSDLDSDDSVAAAAQQSSNSSDDDRKKGNSSSDEEGSGSDSSSSSAADVPSPTTGSHSPSSASSSESGSDSIESSEEDTDPTLDRSLIIPSPRRARPQRTSYTVVHMPRNRGFSSPPQCKYCGCSLRQGELGVDVQHGMDVQWCHVECLADSITGRSVPVGKLKGMAVLSEEERKMVRLAWERDEVTDSNILGSGDDNDDEDDDGDAEDAEDD